MKKIKNHFQKYKDFLKPPKAGDIIKGEVIKKTAAGVFLSLENFKTGIIKRKDLSHDSENIPKIKIGEELMVKIADIENEEGFVGLSLKEASKDLAWRNFRELNEKKEEIPLKVAGANKGGLVFNLSGFQGFLPASQLSREHYPRIENPTPERIFEELKKLVGKEMKVIVIKVDPRNEKLILSER